MNDMNRGQWQGRLRHGLLSGAAAVALGLAAPAFSQQGSGQSQATQSQPSQAPSQQPGSNQPVVVGQLRTAEQALRQSQNELVGSGQPNFAQARTAVDSGLNVIGRVPQEMQGHDVWRTAQRELNEAKQALAGGQPSPQQVATQMREAAEALGTLAGRTAGNADSGGGQQRPGEAQVTMQGKGSGQEGSQQDRQAGLNANQRSGTSAAPGAPAESGGAQAQRVAASSVAGMALQSVQNLVGTNVVGANGRETGEVRNLLIDDSGRVRAAVVEWGGFLGIGERQAMVPIDRIQLGQGNERARLNMTREELEALPRYERDGIAEYGRDRGWGDGLRLFR